MTQTRPEPKVIIIPAKEESPQDQEKKKTLRVAVYCRVSTKKDEQLGSYENQKAYYTEKIMANPNWTMADIFADEGITGTSACKRKDFLRMIRQCRKGKIDMILAKSVSRFARNTVDTLSYTRELRSMGIPVIFEEQNINSIYPESEFLITIHGAFAQSESEGISSRVKWGEHQAMRTGKANIQYKTLLGYEKNSDGEMVVNAEQAETVRKIYELYPYPVRRCAISRKHWKRVDSRIRQERRNGQPPICGRSSLMKNTAVTSCSRRPSFGTASASRSSEIPDSCRGRSTVRNVPYGAAAADWIMARNTAKNLRRWMNRRSSRRCWQPSTPPCQGVRFWRINWWMRWSRNWLRFPVRA